MNPITKVYDKDKHTCGYFHMFRYSHLNIVFHINGMCEVEHTLKQTLDKREHGYRVKVQLSDS